MEKHARFNIGDVVIHKSQGYQALIIDVDPLFQASGRYNPAAIRKGFAHRKPWYRLLINDSEQVAYVEEPHLMPIEGKKSVSTPKIKQYLNNHSHYLH